MKESQQPRGYFGIGIQNGKFIENLGSLWRSADLLGAKFIFTIGKRYKKQASDTAKSFKNIPLYSYETFGDFYKSLPYAARLIGVELSEHSQPLNTFVHPSNCVYMLGAEDHGLTNEAIEKCHYIIQLPGRFSMNVAVAGSIVMYDRLNKECQRKVNINRNVLSN